MAREINLKIRKAKKNEAGIISRLRITTIRRINKKADPQLNTEKVHLSNNKESILEKIKKRDMFCLVKKDKILGIVDLEKDKIGGVFIRWNQIKKGYGQKLLDFIENYAKKKGVRKVKLFSTQYSRPFYRKNNYKFIKKEYWIIDNLKIPCYKMEKRLV